MKRFYPGPYDAQCRAQCRQLKAAVPRAVSAQQAGSGRLKASYSDTIPSKLKTNPGGNQQ